MAVDKHVDRLRDGFKKWNAWRAGQKDKSVDLTNITLDGMDLSYYDLTYTELRGSTLIGADLNAVDLSDSDFAGCDFSDSNLAGATLDRAHANCSVYRSANMEKVRFRFSSAILLDLRDVQAIGADFSQANFTESNFDGSQFQDALFDRAHLTNCKLNNANFNGASFQAAILAGSEAANSDFSGANFQMSMLNAVNLYGSNLSGCLVYGSAAWDVQLDRTTQSDIIITFDGVPRITIDSLEMAQFVYLILNNHKIRDAINVLTTKSVLILGNFGEARITHLYRIKQALREQGFVPIMFDFTPPEGLNMTETIQTLAMLSHFVVIDMSDPRSVPHEMAAIMRSTDTVRIVPIIDSTQKPWGMAIDWLSKPTVAEPVIYNRSQPIDGLIRKIIDEAGAIGIGAAAEPAD